MVSKWNFVVERSTNTPLDFIMVATTTSSLLASGKRAIFPFIFSKQLFAFVHVPTYEKHKRAVKIFLFK